MLQLPTVTWMRFAIWLVVGLVLYFTYGYTHSVLRRRSGGVSEVGRIAS